MFDPAQEANQSCVKDVHSGKCILDILAIGAIGPAATAKGADGLPTDPIDTAPE
jgi:hypothetical protein